MSKEELAAAFADAETKSTKFIERMPELAQFMKDHEIEFQQLWGAADEDGKYDTATASELVTFVTATQKLTFDHFIHEHEH